MTDEKKPFTVSDKRHFTVEGEARDEREDAAAAPSAAPSAPAAVGEPADQAPLAEPDFASLLISLATQASVLLGLAVPPGESPPLDLNGARAIITMLEVLRDKTQGNRTPEEDRLLEDLLYQLRMAYVERSRSRA